MNDRDDRMANWLAGTLKSGENRESEYGLRRRFKTALLEPLL